MPESLAALESSRADLLRRFAQLQDLRPGTVSPVFRRCGKPTCHCAKPNDPGHGPHFQLTFKHDGKTRTTALPNRAAVEKAEQEIAEFRNFEQLCQELVAVNLKICHLRPVTESPLPWSTEEKKRLMRSILRSHAK